MKNATENFGLLFKNVKNITWFRFVFQWSWNRQEFTEGTSMCISQSFKRKLKTKNLKRWKLRSDTDPHLLEAAGVRIEPKASCQVESPHNHSGESYKCSIEKVYAEWRKLNWMKKVKLRKFMLNRLRTTVSAWPFSTQILQTRHKRGIY